MSETIPASEYDALRAETEARKVVEDGLCDHYAENVRCIKRAIERAHAAGYREGLRIALCRCEEIDGDDEFVAGCKACEAAIRAAIDAAGEVKP